MKEVELPLPRLLNFDKIKNDDEVEIHIFNSLHKFSLDAEISGKNERYQPIFGSSIYINGELYTETTYGLPFMQFSQKSKPKITYVNETLFTFNIHYHGLNTCGSIDGTSMEIVFGKSTQLGPKVTFQFPPITNNQSLLWFHNHNMFISMELIYSGAVGLLQIVDSSTKWLNDRFKYSNNHLMMLALDMDFNENGTQTNLNLPIDQNRSAFTVINGISAINWYEKKNTSYVNTMYHYTTDNLVKIDILNATLNWRVYHIGVCDKNKNIKSFYLVQTDSGLINPIKLKMTYIPVAGRISIIFDLNDFCDSEAYVFFYDYDLTEIFDSSQVEGTITKPNSQKLLATVPDFNLSNQSVYPTPIPDPNSINQQDNPTNLNYPKLKEINQINQIITNGTISKPKSEKDLKIKIFLKIANKANIFENFINTNFKLDLNCVIELIKKTIFSKEALCKYSNIISKPYFEYGSVNYLSLLNSEYFYNLPKFDLNVPIRNFLLFPESNINAIASGNENGVTEYIDSANRIMVDLWNSNELNLNYAISQYNLSPNNFKPSVLPTSKFKIYKTNDTYSNTAMISNDTIKIQFFNSPIAYGDKTTQPVYSIKVIFPPTDFLNIQEWINHINKTLTNTNIDLDTYTNLNQIIICDWSFFPYQYQYMNDKNITIKSAVIKSMNTSNYYIRILGRWPILQFFGKSLTASTLNINQQMLNNKKVKFFRNNKEIYNTLNQYHNAVIKNNSQYIKCDEYGIYGIYDADVQAFFPHYATSDGDVQLPIACMKRNGELIIDSNSTFIGLYDGYLNDNLNSFSVKVKSSELWLYSNGDNADNHPIHFHLTSGYAVPNIIYNSANLLSVDRKSNPLIYSRDIFQIGPQETIGFYLRWPYYPSNEKTSSPNISGVGGVIHCHFLAHNDANSMIIQYYIDP